MLRGKNDTGDLFFNRFFLFVGSQVFECEGSRRAFIRSHAQDETNALFVRDLDLVADFFVRKIHCDIYSLPAKCRCQLTRKGDVLGRNRAKVEVRRGGHLWKQFVRFEKIAHRHVSHAESYCGYSPSPENLKQIIVAAATEERALILHRSVEDLKDRAGVIIESAHDRWVESDVAHSTALKCI